MEEPAADSAETQRLLQRLREGEVQALDELLARHRPYVNQLAELRLDPRLRRRIDPSDIVQEVQLEALRRMEDYLRQPPMPFRLWLRQLAHDRMLLMRRFHLGAARRAMGKEVALPERSSLVLARQLLAGGSTPSQRLDQEELGRRVRHAVSQLPEMDREVLLMRTFEGLSFEEVAWMLKINPAAARKRHGRALLRLGAILSEFGLKESQL
jgi:RNA polymerase sigma-70 factor (ECF subfamily)